ncbi:MAG TPA: type II toxin-antitoxin system RelE/ParE family toxin [Terriglobia bacterium]|nr:type II toxin-antitoxin system RelE/ParE family toxin [Terriglobia bacterium]
MSYSLLILRGAARQFAALPAEAFAEVRDRIRRLAADPLPPEAAQIAGQEGWRVRAGSYRVIYEVDTRAARVTVLDVSRRADA